MLWQLIRFFLGLPTTFFRQHKIDSQWIDKLEAKEKVMIVSSLFILNKSRHQVAVEQFMNLAKQSVPSTPTLPDEKTRWLRAKLILEEAFEAVEGLGFKLRGRTDLGSVGLDMDMDVKGTIVAFVLVEPSLKEIMDGCADIRVVTTGCLSACGIPDMALQELVDKNNLAKFGPGHSIRADGKLIKPPDHKPPDIEGLLAKITEAAEGVKEDDLLEGLKEADRIVPSTVGSQIPLQELPTNTIPKYTSPKAKTYILKSPGLQAARPQDAEAVRNQSVVLTAAFKEFKKKIDAGLVMGCVGSEVATEKTASHKIVDASMNPDGSFTAVVEPLAGPQGQALAEQLEKHPGMIKPRIIADPLFPDTPTIKSINVTVALKSQAAPRPKVKTEDDDLDIGE